MRKIFTLLLMFICINVFAYNIPDKPTSRVLDYSNVLTESQTLALSNQLEAIYNNESGTEIQILIVPHIESNTTLSDFSLKYAHQWQLGQKGIDNGMLITVVTDTNKSRIENGYGLEGALPDSFVGMVIKNQFESNFNNKHYYQGLSSGISLMQQQIHNNADLVGKPSNLTQILLIVFIIFMVVIMLLGLLYICGVAFAGDILELIWNIFIILIQIPITIIGGGGSFGGGGASDD